MISGLSLLVISTRAQPYFSGQKMQTEVLTESERTTVREKAGKVKTNNKKPSKKQKKTFQSLQSSSEEIPLDTSAILQLDFHDVTTGMPARVPQSFRFFSQWSKFWFHIGSAAPAREDSVLSLILPELGVEALHLNPTSGFSFHLATELARTWVSKVSPVCVLECGVRI
ncbi:hypothetical protein TNCV_1118791 [Trichonephila clavipes]|uniref:Uncharacterized protein n=1 Tax=Trichonephila clavipes TaxID=2585209 RepID=A0A8X6VSZ4_TRICX|nr:hypothetical protein TNCV_1118791 [Trichonephila clavipes]